VIIKATIELAAKTSSKIYVDLWYTNIYELYLSHWDIVSLHEMTELFDGTVIFEPKPIINNGLEAGIDTTNTCIGKDNKYCPIIPSVLPVGDISSTPESILERNVADVCMYSSLV